MVDAQAVDDAFADEGEYEGVRRREDVRIFLPERGKIVDIEETTIVDLAGAALPEDQPIVLRLDQVAKPAPPLLAFEQNARIGDRRRIELRELQLVRQRHWIDRPRARLVTKAWRLLAHVERQLITSEDGIELVGQHRQHDFVVR